MNDNDMSLWQRLHEALTEEERKSLEPPRDASTVKKISAVWKEIMGVTDVLREKISSGIDSGQAYVSSVHYDKTDDINGPASSHEQAAASDGSVEKEIKKSLIYVVDDEDLLRILLSRILEKQGYGNYRVFSDGDEAASAIFSDDGTYHEIPDLIITDTEMKRMGGPALHEKLKSIPEQYRPAVIAASGNHFNKNAWDAEGVPFVSKPFDAASIASLTMEVLMKRLAAKSKK
jgi:CheY-like chemotaxis protein